MPSSKRPCWHPITARWSAPWRVQARSPAPADSGALHRPPPPAGAGERPPAASRRSGLPWHNPGSGAVGAAIYRVATASRNTNCRGPRARNERHDCNQHLCHGPRRAAAPCAQLWARTATALPMVCLPGLARTGADFETLAARLASDPDRPRRVIALDSRGRGRSDYDRNPANYTLAVELSDLFAVSDRARHRPGGLRRHVARRSSDNAARRGPPDCDRRLRAQRHRPGDRARRTGRIKSYVGKLRRRRASQTRPKSCADCSASQFPKLTDDDWRAFARRTFKEAGGRIVPDYDVKLPPSLERNRCRAAAAAAVEGVRFAWPACR